MAQERLERALQKTRLEWMLCFIGEGQHEKLDELNRQLKQPFNDRGQGKRVDSGFAYWGAGPSYEWSRACGDNIYRVMRDGIESFPGRWRTLVSRDKLSGVHYVSLGVGTGEKDVSVLWGLTSKSPGLHYFPVDMSPDLMRRGVLHVLRDFTHHPEAENAFDRSRVIPVQIDFSVKSNLEQLRTLLDEMLGDAPVLFSLLGNTIANFENESDVLTILPSLVRPNRDFLLLETASTDSVEPAAAAEARDEYAGSRLFAKFAVSSLVQNTDLPIEDEQLQFTCDPVDGCLLIKSLYRSEGDRQFKLIGGDRVSFRKNDTIRLYISRKYTSARLEHLLSTNGLLRLETVPYSRGDSRFGTTLSLCQFDRGMLEVAIRREAVSQPVLTQGEPLSCGSSTARVVFVSYAHEDVKWLTDLKTFLEPDLRNGVIDLWDDKRIPPGADWRDEIEQALDASSAAVLLVSQPFVASQFIASGELPQLLLAAKQRGLRIIWVPIASSRWEETELERLQAASMTEKPLQSLSKHERNTAFVEIAKKIKEAVVSSK